MSQPETPALPTYVDDPSCRETYVDGSQVLMDGSGMIRIEFGVMRWDPDAPSRMNRRLPVARIVMPRQAAVGLLSALQATIEGTAVQSAVVPPPRQ
jgi:hypothetical protein